MLVTQIETVRHAEPGTKYARLAPFGRLFLALRFAVVFQSVVFLTALSRGSSAQPPVLSPADFEHHISDAQPAAIAAAP